MLNKTLLRLSLVAAFSTASLSIQAAEYHVVVPAPGKAASYASIKLELNPASLPVGIVGDAYAGFDFNTALRITGDSELDMSQVAWSKYSGELPDGLSLTRDGRLQGTPLQPGLGSFQALAKYKTKKVVGTYSLDVEDQSKIVAAGGARYWDDGTFAQSCADYRHPTKPYRYVGATGDGLYRIAPNGQPPLNAYCDMTSDGGGWTRVALQYEENPVAWTGQVNGASYTLPQSQIPTHTQTAFGRDGQAIVVDYVSFSYHTGNIAKQVVTSPKTGISYHIFRSANSWYWHHDPENYHYTSPAVSPHWHNTLMIDKVGVESSFDWAFSPYSTYAKDRGYSMNGLLGELDPAGWSVWVR